MPRARAGLSLAVLVLAVGGCGARACSDADERTVQREVEVLTAEPGGAADAAERRLLRRGAAAIPYLETGLYSAEPNARRRVIRVLVEIGDPAAAPILVHLGRRDPDPEVRAAAVRGELRLLGQPDRAPIPAARADPPEGEEGLSARDAGAAAP
jgi:HEAT repeat protein